MFRLAWIAVAALLVADPGLPNLLSHSEGQGADKKSERLRPESRLELVRAISGEFAHARVSLPAGKKGLHIKAGTPLDEKALRQAVANSGSAANAGDTVQITQLEFREREIILGLNGGRSKKRWRDRIQISVSGAPRPTTQTTATDTGAAPGPQGQGAVLFIDFGRPLPDLTPTELKQYLESVLDFSKQRSAAVQWVETLPPEIQKAIHEKRPVVGMDREMVIAAIGKPERKVRERDEEGTEIEDWIYGQPPAKTIFVRFAGERVISVKQFP